MIGDIIMVVLFCIVLFCGIWAAVSAFLEARKSYREEIADSMVDLELSVERFNATIERLKEGNDEHNGER